MTRDLDIFSETENKFIQFPLGSKKEFQVGIEIEASLILSEEMGDNFSQVLSLALDCPSLL